MKEIQLMVLVFFAHFAYVSFAQTNAARDGPQFQPNSNNYSATISETAPVGTTVIDSVIVTSTGRVPRLISLSCQSPYDNPDLMPCSAFQLEPRQQDAMKWIGVMKTARRLDFQAKSSYYLTLVASNVDYTSYQNVSIMLTHEQIRPPIFEGATSRSIPEITDNSSILITQFTARDGDTVDSRFIRYQLISNPGNYFRIEEVTGRLFNTRPLMFSDPGWSQGYVNILVKAAEVLSDGTVGWDDPLTSTVQPSTITLTEASSSPPTFNQDQYTGSVTERSPPSTVVQGISLIVTDTDKSPINSTFELTLSNYANIFEVVPNNATRSVSARITVLNSAAINYDEGARNFSFKVIARETQSAARYSSSADIMILVKDANNYPPVFNQSSYAVAISELILPGTYVIQLLATDRDAGIFFGNDSIRYKFALNNAWLKCDRTTATITVAPCATPGSGPCIDYERFHLLQPTALAIDAYGEGYTTTVQVNITKKEKSTDWTLR